jgi:hypothetical protein
MQHRSPSSASDALAPRGTAVNVPPTIYWTGHFRASRPEAVRKIAKWMSQRAGVPFAITLCERDEVPALCEVVMETVLDDVDGFDDAVLRTFRIWGPWPVRGRSCPRRPGAGTEAPPRDTGGPCASPGSCRSRSGSATSPPSDG